MGGLLRRSLAARIGLLSVGVAAALSLSVTVIGYRKAVEGLRARSEMALGAEALLTGSLVDDWARDRLQGLRALAGLRPVRRLLETAVAPSADDLLAADGAMADATTFAPEIESIALLDPQGRVVRSTDASEDNTLLGSRADFRAALAGRPFASGVGLSELTGEPVVVFSAPALGSNGTVIGVVRARTALGPVRGFVDAARDRAGPGAQGILIDEAGLVMSTTVKEGAPLQPLGPLSPEEQRALVQEKRWRGAPPPSLGLGELSALRTATKAATVRFRLGQAEQLGVALPLHGARWTYFASLPAAEVERTARDLLRNAVLATTVGLLLAALLSALVAQRVVGSIRRLTEVSARVVSEGDLTQTLESTSQDEVGQLTRSFARMVEALREALSALKISAGSLSHASGNLHTSMEAQAEFIARQAAALQETQVTAQEIKQTSTLAAERAQAVLLIAERAESIGRSGETAVERSIGSLAGIGRHAVEVGDQIQRLSESTRQIGGITLTVKDLADQSNMLALNAAIEAVRSGEHGKSFAVVAREIRSLADQSIQATTQVGAILSELTRSISATVTITHQSSKGMEAGLAEVKASGDNLRELSGITRESTASVRQIAAAVSQQHAGIGQIFSAVTHQLEMMEQVRDGLARTREASNELQKVAQTVAGTLARYRL